MSNDPTPSQVMYDLGAIVGTVMQFCVDHWMLCLGMLCAAITGGITTYSQWKHDNRKEK